MLHSTLRHRIWCREELRRSPRRTGGEDICALSHLAAGKQAAYFHVRKLGYTKVAEFPVSRWGRDGPDWDDKAMFRALWRSRRGSRKPGSGPAQAAADRGGGPRGPEGSSTLLPERLDPV